MRVQGIDVARGVASLVMIQGHAYQGWVASEFHGSAGYRFTRLLGTVPLPAFLVLAGAAVMWRVEVAAARGEEAPKVRRGIVRRGFEVLLWGYLVSGLYMLMDGGEGLETLLRADVLHVIGLSIAIVGGLGIRPGREGTGPSPARFAWTAAIVALVTTLLCPWISRLSPEVTGPARYVVALFADVPGVTRMPVVPLVAWFGGGAAASFFMWRARERLAEDDEQARRVGASSRFGWTLLGVSLAMAFLGERAMLATVDALGGTISRAHPAVWFNVVDLAGRGLIILAVGVLLTPHLHPRARAMLIRLGQGSLVAYVFHIPFCYGALGEGIRGRIDMATSTALVLLLMVASYLAVWLRDSLRSRLRERRASALSPTLLTLAFVGVACAAGCEGGADGQEASEVEVAAEAEEASPAPFLERGPQAVILHRPMRAGQRFREDTEVRVDVSRGSDQSTTTVTFQARGEVKGVDDRGIPTRIEYEILDLILSSPTEQRALVSPGTRLELVRSAHGNGSLTSGGRPVMGEAESHLRQLLSTALPRFTEAELWGTPGAVSEGAPGAVAVGETWEVRPDSLIESIRESARLPIRPGDIELRAQLEDVVDREGVPTQIVLTEAIVDRIRVRGREHRLRPIRFEMSVRHELPMDSTALPAAIHRRFLNVQQISSGGRGHQIHTENIVESRFTWL